MSIPLSPFSNGSVEYIFHQGLYDLLAQGILHGIQRVGGVVILVRGKAPSAREGLVGIFIVLVENPHCDGKAVPGSNLIRRNGSRSNLIAGNVKEL